MDQTVAQFILDFSKAIIDKQSSINWIEMIFSILSPVLVGVILAIIGFRFDKKKQDSINTVVQKMKDLTDKIESQKILIEALNRIEVQNKIHSMEIAKIIYADFYSLYWNRVDNNADFDNLFQKAKKSMYENSIYIDNNILNNLKKILYQFARLISPNIKDDKSEILKQIDEEMNNLKCSLIKEYNLLGKITSLE